MLRTGIIGLGHWGPNLARVLHSLPDCQVAAICDCSKLRLQRLAEQFPHAVATCDVNDVLSRDVVDAVVIATPTRTHFPFAKKALELGIHTFVEKPLATSSEECRQLINLADEQQVILFVGHVFLYSAAVAKLKELVSSGDLGDLYYISSTRLNLGPVRQDVNALWDLAPHDVSIMLELMSASPTAVSCAGLAHLNDHVHDVCSLSLHFEGKRMGIVHVSWLDPHKKRVMTVVGSKKMAVYDDIEPLEKIKVYDHGIDTPTDANSYGEFPFSYRYGDTYSPRLVEVEPLKSECRTFVNCVNHGTRPRTDGRNGLDVVRVIEAADVSLRNGNGRIDLEPLTAISFSDTREHVSI